MPRLTQDSQGSVLLQRVFPVWQATHARLSLSRLSLAALALSALEGVSLPAAFGSIDFGMEVAWLF